MRTNGTGTVEGAGTTRTRLRGRWAPTSANGGGDRLPSDHIDERKLLEVLNALRKGNFSPRLPDRRPGLAGKVADPLNEVLDINQRMAKELERVARVVGKEGKINHRASLGEFSGLWAASLESVNALVGDLVHPTSEMARVIGGVAKGDLTQ